MKTEKKLPVLALLCAILFTSLLLPRAGAVQLGPGGLSVSGPIPDSLTASGGCIAKDITLQPGSDESRMNFCWYSSAGGTCWVQIAKKSEMTGSEFPASARYFSGTAGSASQGYYSDKVTVTGLEASTEYAYRVGNGSGCSGLYSFKTGNCSSYQALFLSDAQIGASGSASKDQISWENTLAAALGSFQNASFILSAGDQVDYSLSESEYDRFFASPYLRQMPLAPAVGNHENISKSPICSYHFNEPNESSSYGLTPAGGDYWFRYGYTLYMVLNTNNASAAEHDSFIGQAVGANPDAFWKVLMFHQSIYSSAAHSTASSVVALRDSLPTVIDKYQIDLVLAGHDHCYTRSFQMLGGVAQQSQTYDPAGRVVDPTGTLYITAGSASGSKYYDLKPDPEAYAAVRLQSYVPTVSSLVFSGKSLTVTTYRTDTMEAIDTCAIVKNPSSGFIDVPDSAWYSPAVKFIAENHITLGTGDDTFSPGLALSRGQFIVLLLRAYGIAPDPDLSDNFSDAGSTYYTGYLAAAKHLGISQGVGNNEVMPEGCISRQDMFTMLYNALKVLNKLPAGTDASVGAYSDGDQIAAYAETPISVLSSGGVISGSEGRIDPAATSTRAQMAQVLYRLLSK